MGVRMIMRVEVSMRQPAISKKIFIKIMMLAGVVANETTKADSRWGISSVVRRRLKMLAHEAISNTIEEVRHDRPLISILILPAGGLG
jgi:hypothetical protein